MAKYQIKLYAHGVPNGQDIWGNPGAEAKYLEAFYGRQSKVSSQMFVDVMQFGGDSSSYYTFFRYGNFMDKGGRPGGYFALTLKINYFYTDIQNIYNLLEAAYNKYMVGTVVEQIKGGARFLVAKLDQAENYLKALEKELEHYLMQFSSDADFISMNGFKSNGLGDYATINLLEATPVVVTNHVKANAKISVSPQHPTSREQRIINKMNGEIQAANANAQQQIAAVQKAKEDSISTLKTQYQNADQTISQLRSQLESAKSQVAKLTTDVQKCQQYKGLYERNSAELEKTKRMLASYRSGRGYAADTYVDDSGFMPLVKKLHPYVCLMLIVALTVIVVMTKCQGGDSTNETKATIEQVDPEQQVAQLDEDTLTNEQNDSLAQVNAINDSAKTGTESNRQNP